MTLSQEFTGMDEYEALCVSVADGVTPARAIDVLCGGEQKAFRSWDEMLNWAADYSDPDATRQWLVAGVLDGKTFVWEDNGWRGVQTENASELSRGGRFCSVYWNINALSSFVFASDGEVRTEFEPFFAPNLDEAAVLIAAGGSVDLQAWEVNRWSTSLAVQAQVLGLSQSANTDWLDLPGLSYWGSTF